MAEEDVEELIPGLHNDISTEILARISHGHHRRMQAVSRRWRSLFGSSQFMAAQERLGCGDWLLVLTHEPRGGSWAAFDPDAEEWHHLPPAPGGLRRFFSCVAVARKLYIIGGLVADAVTDEVLQFDLVARTWSRTAPMRLPRFSFACAYVGDKVYVAGGLTRPPGSVDVQWIAAAEVYDIQLNTWEELPPMPSYIVDSQGLNVRGLFHVVGNTKAADVYDPAESAWHSIPEFWYPSKSGSSPSVSHNGYVYTLDDWDQKLYRSAGLGWESFPLDLNRKYVGFGIAKLRNNLYIFGGKYFCNRRSHGPESLADPNWVRFQIASSNDVYVVPLEVQQPVARPVACMGRSRGYILGSATYEEQSQP